MLPFDDVLEREIRIAARPETIFAFFTDPVKLIRWKGMRASLDARPGGLFRVDINGRDVARGEYLEITPPNHIVLTWGWEGENSPLPPGASTVDISLRPDGPATIVRLRHSGLPSWPLYQQHAQGWDHYLPRLSLAAEGRDPGSDPNVSSEVPHIPSR